MTKDKLKDQALLASRETIQIMRRRLEIAEARLDVLDTLAHITGRRIVCGGSGYPDALKLIEEALALEVDPPSAPRRTGGSTKI